MRRVRPILLLLALLIAVPAASAGAAVTGNLLKVVTAYQQNGKVPPCTFTTKQLNDALKNVTRDLRQYQPDFEDAVRTAIEQRAAGACGKKSQSSGSSGTGTPAAPSGSGGDSGGNAPAGGQTSTGTAAPSGSTPSGAPAGATPQPAPTVDPAPAVANDAIPAAAISAPGDGADETPAPLLVLALMLGLLLALGALWAAVRWMGFNPPWLQRWRHASHEAGWRASAAWSEFTDWVRLGR
jgi:cobalamin biosynthesis Mg chelatase CobN